MPRQKASHIDSPSLVGRRLRSAREQAGLTQRELSFPGCSAAYISRIEAGERTPSLQLLRELGRRLGVSADYLAVGDEAAPGIDEVTEAELVLALGEREEAKSRFSSLLDRTDGVERARALTGLAAMSLDEAAVDDARAQLDEAVELLRDRIAEFPRTVEAFVRCCAARGDFETAAGFLTTLLSRVPAMDPRSVQYGVLLANVYIDQGDHARAASLLGDLRAATDTLRDPILLAKTLWSQSRLHIARTNPTLAAQFAGEAIAVIRATEHQEYAARAHHVLAYIELERGDAGEALRLLDEAWPLIAAGRDRLIQAQFRLERARALAMLDRVDEARAIATQLLGELDRLSPVDATRCAGVVADVLARTGDSKGALETYAMAVELLPRRDSPMLVDLYTRWSDVLAAEGRTEEALAVARRALGAQRGAVEQTPAGYEQPLSG
jgi:tetratricopeptide (TPR) repeat protein